MDPERWQTVVALFERAAALGAEARADFVRGAAGGDRELERRVLAMLHADTGGGRRLEEAIEAGATTLCAALGQGRVGQRVGPYRLVRLLGEGGMSSVYEAVRDDAQYEQRVALKLVRAGMATESVLERLRNERQILAKLDHPNIAALHDGGTTDDGLPYFVMEYVDGVPLLAYCSQNDLSLVDRLALFCTICEAVEHAHRHLVVHRDLKPSNILVSRDGLPKLLDFGIARILDDRERSAEVTAGVLRFFTPGYASPEQIRGGRVTTASDVYSLGVVLYELLAGERPFGKADTREEPVPPSARNASWRRHLRGDLDDITLKALRPEPERRYGSALDFARDVRRHLDALPVAARSGTLGYRASRFVRRHRVGVAATLAVLLTGIVAGALLLRQVSVTRGERDKAQAVSAMLVDLFEVADPAQARGDSVTVQDLLDHGAERVESLSDQPELQATLLRTLGNLYDKTGELDRAGAAFERSAALYGEAAPLERAAALHDLGRTYAKRGQLARAETLFREALTVRLERLSESTAEAASSLNALALSVHEQGRHEEAEPLYRRALAADLASVGEADLHTQRVRGNLALLLLDRGDFAGAEQVFRDVLQSIGGHRGATETRMDVAEYLEGIGMTLTAQGRPAEAIDLLEQAVELRVRLVGRDHFLSARSLDHLGAALLGAGRLDEAAAAIEESLAVRLARLDPGHPEIASSYRTRGKLLATRGRLADARADLALSVELYSASLGPEHPFTRDVRQTLERLDD